MKNSQIIKLAIEAKNVWVNDEYDSLEMEIKIKQILEPIQEYINELSIKIDLYNNNSSTFLILGNFKESKQFANMAWQYELRLEKIDALLLKYGTYISNYYHLGDNWSDATSLTIN